MPQREPRGWIGPLTHGSGVSASIRRPRTAAQLYDFISHQTPQDKPGTLSQQQYLDVTAYILSRNGLPDCLAEMDYSTGQILDAIKEAGIEENTIVIFSPPNGERERIADEGAR
jgi:arylsulfatase A-like enzyme